MLFSILKESNFEQGGRQRAAESACGGKMEMKTETYSNEGGQRGELCHAVCSRVPGAVSCAAAQKQSRSVM